MAQAVFARVGSVPDFLVLVVEFLVASAILHEIEIGSVLGVFLFPDFVRVDYGHYQAFLHEVDYLDRNEAGCHFEIPVDSHCALLDKHFLVAILASFLDTDHYEEHFVGRFDRTFAHRHLYFVADLSDLDNLDYLVLAPLQLVWGQTLPLLGLLLDNIFVVILSILFLLFG